MNVVYFQGVFDFYTFIILLLFFFTETLEKLAKREKEVSTLTTQVDDLKTQISGNEYVLHVDPVCYGEISAVLPYWENSVRKKNS